MEPQLTERAAVIRNLVQQTSSDGIPPLGGFVLLDVLAQVEPKPASDTPQDPPTAPPTAPARPPRRAQREASQMTGSEGGQPRDPPPGPVRRVPRGPETVRDGSSCALGRRLLGGFR